MKPTCDLYDDYLDTVRVLPAGFRSFGAVQRFSGPAVTVKCFEDNSRIKDLSATPGEGRVMMVDAGGSLRTAVMGDMIAEAAAGNGWAGVVIWGAVRDVAALAEIGMGIFALGHTPRKSVRRDEGQIGLEISMNGVEVLPGELIVADEDGVLIFPATVPRPGST